ncbi:IS21 family transposase [Psychrobium sp. nBUS_13]|uniref:IS21 family transposase n=1 Tax=Psychrobium sp. nBUS_13 TaxID=3395319 RepID=UPI003EC0050F
MSTVPIFMRKLKEILRLKYGCSLSHRQVAKSLSISPSVVSRYANRAAQMGITSWPLSEIWTDAALNREFLKTRVKLKASIPVPNWSVIYKELKHKTLTLQLLWEEHSQRNPGNHYSYNHFCRLYKAWLGCQKPSMRQHHKAGEKLFIDYCGPTMNIINSSTGEYRTAQVFVAVMGASNYTFAEATWSQGLEDWVMSHARCFEFLGGMPELLIPDNLRSGVTKACRYEPDLNPTYQQMAAHYNTVIVPARPYRPKDKAKAEVAVQIVERWIMAKLRHEPFFSLRQLNERICELLTDLNQRPMRKQPGSRLSQFIEIDKPALKPLPITPYIYTQVKKVTVHIDYHIEVEKHYYSVPHSLIKQKLEAHISGELVRLYHHGECVASHPRSSKIGAHTTIEGHMPIAHRKHDQWSPHRFEKWAKDIGSSTEELVIKLLQSKRHPEQSYRVCLGLLNLSKKYSPARLEAASRRALHTGIMRLAGIRSILDKGLDRQPLPEVQLDLLGEIEHKNVRGNKYYH